MSLAADLLEDTQAALRAVQDSRAVPRDARWAMREGTVGEQRATIEGWAWYARALAWFRVAVLDGGPRTQVFSALALPDPAFELPLFGAEVVAVSGAVTVVAFDWIPVFRKSPSPGALAAIRAEFPHFPPGGDLPAWATDSFSPFALFSRPRGAVSDAAIRAAYNRYLEGYLALCGEATSAGSPERTLHAQRAYCESHFANDPGGNMLAKIFGRAWAEQYARTFLFRLPT